MRRRRILPMTTKKHLARAERERRQRRWILAGTLTLLVVVIGLLAGGWLQTSVLQLRQPVAVVDGESITTGQFQSRVRLARISLLSQANNVEQMRSLFGDDPTFSEWIDQQLTSIEQQLADPASLGLTVLEAMIDESLIRQEADRRGITVTEGEVRKAMEEDFGFYAEGTPTPPPTSTPGPATPTSSAPATSLPQPTAEPTQTATPGPSPTITVTPTPFPTATAYTRQAFEENYANRIALFEGLGADEEALLSQYRARLYRERLLEAFGASIPREQEQVRAEHILVADEETARQVLSRLEAGEAWDELAADFSLDESNKDNGGDLGWFPQGLGVMDSEFETAAFTLAVGEVSQPVETQFGWHIIRVLDRETRAMDESLYQQVLEARLSDWLAEQRDQGKVEVKSYWVDRVPTDPTAASLFATG